MKFLAVCAVAATALFTTSAAQAATVERVTGTDVLSIMNEVGLSGRVDVDNEGDPMIRGSIQGQNFILFFYRCNKQQEPRSCMDLQFHFSMPNDMNVTFAVLNAYNRDNRFGQAFFEKSGEIGLDMSATLQGGVTRQHIKEVIDWWKVTLTSFPRKLRGN